MFKATPKCRVLTPALPLLPQYPKGHLDGTRTSHGKPLNVPLGEKESAEHACHRPCIELGAPFNAFMVGSECTPNWELEMFSI